MVSGTRRVLAGVVGMMCSVVVAAPASASVSSTDFFSGIGATVGLARQLALSDAKADGYAPADCTTISTGSLGHSRWEVTISCTH